MLPYCLFWVYVWKRMCVVFIHERIILALALSRTAFMWITLKIAETRDVRETEENEKK